MAWFHRSQDRLPPLVVSGIGTGTQVMTHLVLEHLGGDPLANGPAGQWIESAINSTTQYLLQTPFRTPQPPQFYQIAAIHDPDYTQGYFAYSFDLTPDHGPQVHTILPPFFANPAIATIWLKQTQHPDVPILNPDAHQPLDIPAWSLWLDAHLQDPVTPLRIITSDWYLGAWAIQGKTQWLAWHTELTDFGFDIAVLPPAGHDPLLHPPQLYASQALAQQAVRQYDPHHPIHPVPYFAPTLHTTLNIKNDLDQPGRILLQRTLPRPISPLVPGNPTMLPRTANPADIPDTGAPWYWHPVHPDQPDGPTIAWKPIAGTEGVHFAGRWSAQNPQLWRYIEWPTRDQARQEFQRHHIWAQRAPRLIPIDLTPWLNTPNHPIGHPMH